MKLITLLFLISGMFIPFSAFPQTADDNHDKYWYYRYRLKNHFVKVGKNPGESLVASQRAGHERQTDLSFGDQTVALGMYIAVLAMEYHFLASNNQYTEETLDELFHAMYAFNRLDLNAESLFRNPGSINPQPGDLNGFFVKDDATDAFFSDNLSHFNSTKIKSNYLVSTLNSQWESAIDKGHFGGAEMSQDQLFYILMGCAMVKKFIPRGLAYKNEVFQDGQRFLEREAAEIAMRMTSHLNWTRFTTQPNLSSNILFKNWRPVNPIYNKEVEMEQAPYLWSYAIGKATNIVTFPYYVPNISQANSGTPAQHTPFSNTTGRGLWHGLGGAAASKNGFIKQDQAHMCALLNALIGRSNANPVYAGLIAAWDVQHAPLIKQVLFGGTNPYFTKKSYRDLLNDAPCTGPFLFDWSSWDTGINSAGNRSYEWSTSDRITHPERRGGNDAQFTGEFPGMDYMLFHNLYYMVQKDEYRSPVNLMTRQVSYDLPRFIFGMGLGSTEYPITVKAFGKIVAKNKITTIRGKNGAATYRAGCEIILKDGFEVSSGSEFRAHIERFSCSNNSTYYLSAGKSPENEPQNAAQNEMAKMKLHESKQLQVQYDFKFNEKEDLIEEDIISEEVISDERKPRKQDRKLKKKNRVNKRIEN